METFKQQLLGFQSVTMLHSESELNNEHTYVSDVLKHLILRWVTHKQGTHPDLHTSGGPVLQEELLSTVLFISRQEVCYRNVLQSCHL